MSKADELYLMQLDFGKRAEALRKSTDQKLQAIVDEERRSADERERRAAQEAASTTEGKSRAMWDVDSRKYGYYEDED
ncbi:hypothetical protein Srot_1731 [Segniliparus rotundus DSM 44985]|uniref:Uncharacterized protein n=1 Tax=Segniliparus rotundus (strain ATCC BAA-972 / CDC 1076 / CIP 108378 / DSM 44985 / JCM 13578) TaxID=640132 RepID=D6Z8B1_SEGRD|nr:hypothetical protein [Segniliparus rotundus]ADG98191.1 hypothetical protein Srot_1731 [Segniliparus rotundus DSM 44985]